MPSGRHAPLRTAMGTVVQAGLPKGPVSDASETTFLVRGVVTAVYTVDDPAHPYASGQPCAAYCDVVVYTRMAGGRIYPLFGVLVTYDAAGVQGGQVRLPRATTQALGGGALDPSSDVDFASLDGDHILIGFVDHSRQNPVLLRYLPHPQADVGQGGALPAGRRTRMVLKDGSVDLRKHHGGFSGHDQDGNFVANAAAAGANKVAPDGREVPGTGTGRVELVAGPLGSRTTRIATPTPAGETDMVREVLNALSYSLTFLNGPGGFAIAGAAGPILAAAAPGAGGAATAGIKIGTGGTPVARAESVASVITSLIAWLATHTHGGPGSPPVQAPALPTPPTKASLGAKGIDLPG